MSELVIREDLGAVARLTLNSPGNFNALSSAMMAALADALDRIAQDAQIRVVTLAGAGRAFCAGHDLREMQAARKDRDGGKARFHQLFSDCAALMQRFPAMPQVVIAQVGGVATAAGCQLVASCDMAVAAGTARFGVNGIDLGLFCATPMVALTRAIPPRAAFELLVTGDFISAEQAQALGLVNRVVPAEDLAEATMTLGRKVADKLPQAIRRGKAAFYRQRPMTLADAYTDAAQVMCENIMLAETDEAMTAFTARRKPGRA